MVAPDAARAARAPWTRSLVVSALALAAVAVAGAAWRSTASTPAYATGPGTVLVSGTDFDFSPGRIVWRVGERVTLTFENESDGRPAKPHELMIGREPLFEPTPFGARPTDGFARDFFSGVGVRLVRSEREAMLMPGRAKLAGAGASEGEAMPGMEMEGSAPMEGMGSMGDAAERNFMLMLGAGGSATISFVVPDRPGRWEIACFAQSGQHYLNGMRGTIVVENA